MRVTYYWLDSLSTGHVLAGFLPPTLRQALGRNYPVVRNDVFEEVSVLFERFGTTAEVPTDDEVTIQACFATGKRDGDRELIDCGDNLVQFYRDQQSSASTASGDIKRLPDIEFFVPLPDDEDIVGTTDRWPDGFNFSYGWYGGDLEDLPPSGERIYMPALTLWRQAERADIRNLRRRIGSYVQDFVDNADGGLVFGFPVSAAPAGRDERLNQSEWFPLRTDREIPGARLLEFISRDADLADLAVVSGTNATCGGGWQFTVRGPQFKLLVGVVENAGSDAVSLSGIDVWSADETELRPLPDGKPADDQTWSEDTIAPPIGTLLPGEGLMVPMRIEFRADLNEIIHSSDGETYDALRALPPDTPLFFFDGDVSKAAGSFGPHREPPSDAAFAYGPEIWLKQARVANQEVALRQVDPTAVSMFVGYERGSCPFVYGFDSERDRWQLQSRAVVGATSRTLAYEDNFPLDHFDGRLKIVELDPEVSFLDDIVVDVTLANGAVHRLLPDDQRLRYRDGTNFIIAYPDSAEIAFSDFESIDEPIKSVEVRVFGYYREFGVPLRSVAAGMRGPTCDPVRRQATAQRAISGQRSIPQ